MMSDILKTCSFCGQKLTARDLIYDPKLEIIGMVYDYGDQKSHYVFQHNIEGCGTSLLIETGSFIPFIDEPILADLIILSEKCEGHCVNLEDIRACRQACRNAPFRRFLLFMLEQKAKTRVHTL